MFTLCICGQCDIGRPRANRPFPCIDRCGLAFQLSRCHLDRPIEWSRDMRASGIVNESTSPQLIQYLEHGAMDYYFPQSDSAAGDPRGAQLRNLYRISPDIPLHLQFTARLGAAQDFERNDLSTTVGFLARDLSLWYLRNRQRLFPRETVVENGRPAKCLYALINPATGSPLTPRLGRAQFSTMLIDIFQATLTANQHSDGDAARIDISFIWAESVVCDVCGRQDPAEFIPFINCRRCGARPAFHHGRCCPAQRNRQDRVTGAQWRRRHYDLRSDSFLVHLMERVLPEDVFPQLFLDRLFGQGLTDLTEPP